MFEFLGYHPRHDSIELYRKDGTIYACSGWNGGEWTDCWIVDDLGYHIENSPEIDDITPVYRQNPNGDYEMIDIEIT